MPRDKKSNEKRSTRADAPYDRQHNGKKEGRSGRKHGSGDDASPVASFDEMNLKPDLLKGIYAYGFEKPSAIQQRAIRPIVRGRDVIAQSQSGTGKTAVFAISALQLLDETSRDVQVLILSPTRELAEQSQRVVQSLGDFMNVRNFDDYGGMVVWKTPLYLLVVLWFLIVSAGQLSCMHRRQVAGK
jgi:superfamily II DNA/RNA helicase